MTLNITTNMPQRTADLEELCELGLPLIKIQLRGKKPIKDENWATVCYFDRKPEDFFNINVGVKCDFLKNGKHLAILDIDAKYDGWNSLTSLCYDLNIDLPPTFSTATGGGGAHYYFLMDEAIRKRPLSPKYPGIDFQGAGSYCVGPGSIHENGKLYYIDSNDPIAQMPQALVDLLNHWGEPNEKFFDGSKVETHFGDIETVPKGARNNYLMQVGGALRRAGLSAEAIAAALIVVNNEKCDPPGDTKSVRQIALNAAKYEPTEAIAPQITEKAPPVTKSLLSNIAKTKYDKGFSENFEKRRGLVKSIATNILDNCDRKYPQYALAAADAILAACSQGAYVTPGIGGAPGSSPTLYQWIVGPSAAGKDAYRYAVDVYLKAVDQRLLFAKAGSVHGFFANFFVSNSGVYMQDEFQDFMRAIYSKGQNHLRGIEDIWKECYNDLPNYPGVMLARSKYPDAMLPRLSVFGVGTTSGYLKNLTNDAISGGLISRYAVIPAIDIPDKSSIGKRVSPKPEEIEQLKSIVQFGMTDAGKAQGDGAGELTRLYQSMEKGGVKFEHRAQFEPTIKMQSTPEADARILAYNKEREIQFKYFVKKDMADDDTNPASIADRAPRFVSKRSALEAIGRDAVTVDLVDIENSIEFVDLTTNWVLDKITRTSGGNDFERLGKKLLGFLREQDKPVRKTRLFKACGNNVTAAQINVAIESLAIKGDLLIYLEKDATEVMVIQDVVPTRGVFYGASE